MMNMRDLIPWGRQDERGLSLYQPEESSPFASFHRQVNRLFDEALHGFDTPRGPTGMAVTNWPRLEASENEHEVRVTAELPGMNEKDVELSIDDGVLTIRGEKKAQTEDRVRGYSECFYGRFERRLALPQGVMEDKCDAAFKNGLLTIHLPKSAEAKARARRIPISTETMKH